MRLSPDEMIFWQYGLFKLNGTIVFTWALMFVLAAGSKLITSKLSTGLERSRWQSLLEIVVTGIEKQIGDVGLRHPETYIGFLGTLFLFVALASVCTIIPGYEPPTGSLSTTAALALCVLVAVPFFGIKERGLGRFGLGMMGLIGWSVAIPTLLGAALGMWLDRHYPGKHAWTLALLVAGLSIGCLNAWHWVAKEDKAMRDEREDGDE